MAKKKSDPTTPQVSNLPLPKSDTPLVIDLPDGQKLVVGKMQTGTVIEVATWRGTGRPDSRTNRMMLGVSVAGQNAAPQNDSSSSGSASGTSSKVTLKKKFNLDLKGLLNRVTKSANQVIGKFKSGKAKEKTDANAVGADSSPSLKETITPKPVAKLSSDMEIDEWLNKVKEKRAARIAREADSAAKKPIKKSANQKKKKSDKR